MSNALTGAARGLCMDPIAKAVLMALADMARDPDDPVSPAQAWPPMHGTDGKVGLCDWTCLSERSVQRGLKALMADGLVARRQLRHGAVYTVLVPTPVTQSPDCQSPDTQSPTPVPLTGKALLSTNRRKKASPSPSTRDVFPRPDGVDPDHWRDFLANRQRRRMTNTATAHKRLIADLARIADAEWPAARLIEHAAAKGWGGIYDPRQGDTRHGNLRSDGEPRADRLRGDRPDPAVDMLRTAIADDPARGAADRGGVGATLPAYLNRRP